MSLINKMLRDLDSRHAVGGQATLPSEVRSLPEPPRPPRVSGRIWLLLVLAAIGVGAAQSARYWLPFLPPWPWLPVVPKPAAAVKPPRPAPPPVPKPAPAAVVSPAPAPTVATTQAVTTTPTVVAPTPTLPTAMAAGKLSPAPIESRLPSLSETLPPPEVLSSATAVHEAATSPVKAQPARAQPERVPPATAAIAAPRRTAPATAVRVVIDKAQSPSSRAEADYLKGVAAYRQGRIAEAAAQFRAALQADPRHLAARQTLIAMLAGQKQWADAEALLKQGLQLLPEQTAWAMALARIEVERGNLATAWDTLQQYAAAGRGNADYQGFAGVLLMRLHQPHAAASHYQAALRLRPREGRWWLGLGLSLEAEGRATLAQDAYRHAETADGLTPEMKAFLDKKLH